ncbi:hypothetical protein [Pedobacter cryoconitis]|uniref:hypothetical protein n=1 Tax=Pedobacter cryoconitis TaxID=188932 RepID=UPI001617E02B|nr:hypothetical protein [Pedobacter cryoconitis]MBB5648262.1 hypothetical protein [Pedobacter cryoconitis]
MMKFKIQPLIIFLGIVSLIFSGRQMLQTKTMILPSWFLTLFFLLITLCVSFALGVLAKKMLNSKWQTRTFASIFAIAISLIYYVSQYRSAYTVFIPKDYVGEVRLLVSNEKENDFFVNKYGIGYINRTTFDEGFYPKIIKGDNDITKQVKEYSKGALATTSEDVYSYEYLSFSVPAKTENIEDKDIEELIKIKAIDTTRLYKRKLLSQ